MCRFIYNNQTKPRISVFILHEVSLFLSLKPGNWTLTPFSSFACPLWDADPCLSHVFCSWHPTVPYKFMFISRHACFPGKLQRPSKQKSFHDSHRVSDKVGADLWRLSNPAQDGVWMSFECLQAWKLHSHTE